MLKGFQSKTLLVPKGPRFKVSSRPTRIDDLYWSDEDYDSKLKDLQNEMADLQDALYAERKQALLCIFQGMDAAGKDSAIKHVFSGLNPQGVVVHAFAKPSFEDLDHDFLWRTHKRVPPRGRIGIFNRSYYEEVLTVRVHSEYLENERLPKSTEKNKNIWKDRFEDIRSHELYLTRQGIRVVKFLLHVSRKEQRERFLARLEKPGKNWKFDPNDFQDRRLWTKYEKTFDECLPATSTALCPWYAVPADDKKNARLMIAQIVVEQLKAMKPQYPAVSPERKRVLKKIEKALK